MMIVVCLTVIAIVLALQWYIVLKIKYKCIEKIPGPQTYPLIGNVLDITKNNFDVLNNITKLSEKYGPLVQLWFGPTNLTIVTTNPKHAEHILTTKNLIEKGSWKKIFTLIFGECLPFSSAEIWRKQRKLIAPIFNAINLEKCVPIMKENVNCLMDSLELLNSEPVNITPCIATCSMQIICQTVLYTKLDSVAATTFRKSVDEMLVTVKSRTFSVLSQSDFLFKQTNMYKRQMNCRDTTLNIVKNCIEKRRIERLEANVSKTTVLDHLLDQVESNDNFGDIDIPVQIMSILVAGFETMESAVSFCLFEIARHPKIQQKILEEIEIVVNKKCISYHSIHKMAYVECVFKETLRLYPPVPFIERQAEEEITLDTFKIPEGATYMINIYGIHHDEKNYPEPDKFDPDRFLPGNKATRHSHAFIPFAAGMRDCLGRKFALMEAKLLIAKVVQNFELSLADPDHKPNLRVDMSLKCTNGVPIVLKKRKS